MWDSYKHVLSLVLTGVRTLLDVRWFKAEMGKTAEMRSLRAQLSEKDVSDRVL